MQIAESHVIEGFEAEYNTFNVEPLSQPVTFEAEYFELLKRLQKGEKYE